MTDLTKPAVSPVPSAPKLTLIKFSSRTCPACASMSRTKVLERFIAAHPAVTLITLDCVDEEGETPRGSQFAKNFELSNAYGVESFPTLIFESETGGELASWEGGVPYRELEKTYEAAVERFEASREVREGNKA